MSFRLLFFLLLPALAAGQTTIYEYLTGIANRQLAARRDDVAKLRTAEDVRQRGARTREKLIRWMGGLPSEKGPLNLKRTGVLQREGYRVEKVVFESQPNFFVTGNLYIPTKGRGPFPAVIQATGHSATAKARELYQSLSIGLAQYGFVVLTYDPLGQGERRIYWDQQQRDSIFGAGTTTEHQMVGVQALLAGESMARLMVWDGMRGIDVLESLPEVDAAKIGAAGCSGGGTLTSYLAAIDPRVKVAAPACYISAWEEQLQGTGPQDAEQQFPGQLAEGVTHGDLVEAFAPKPYLICSTTDDFFPLAGAKRTFDEAKQIWTIFDLPNRVEWFTAPGGHGMRADTRSAIYAWMKRWLRGDAPEAAPELPRQVELDEDLQVTPTGQLITSFGGDTASTLSRKRYAAIPVARPATDQLKSLIVQYTKYEPAKAPLNVSRQQPEDRGSFTASKVTYQVAPGHTVPAMLYQPKQVTDPAPVLYAGPAGKAGPDAVALAAGGNVVLAIDTALTGEAVSRKPTYAAQWFGEDRPIWLALMVGKTITGLRMEEMIRGLDALRELRPEITARVRGVAKGTSSVAMLHAAALDARLGDLWLEEMPTSYRDIATAPLHRQMFDAVLPGVLYAYDLPDIAAAFGARVHLINTVNPMGQVLPLVDVKRLYGNNALTRRRELEALSLDR